MFTSTATQQPAPSSSLKRLINRHPLVAYFVVAFAGTWLFLLPIVLSQRGSGLLPFTLPDVAFIVLYLLAVYTGPTLAAFLVTAATSGKAGVRHLLRRYVQWRVGLRWYLLVFFGYPVIHLLAASVVLGAAPLNALAQRWPLFFTFYLPNLLTFQLISVLGEEPGWRGFALPRLQQRYGALLGSLILGVLIGLWHFPAYFVPGLILQGPFDLLTEFVVNTFGIVILMPLWTWVFNNAGGSILIAILLHCASNASVSFVFSQLLDLASFGTTAVQQILVWDLVAIVGSALLIIIFTRGRLSYKPNHVSQIADAPLAKE